jgi:hypothetical protein
MGGDRGSTGFVDRQAVLVTAAYSLEGSCIDVKLVGADWEDGLSGIWELADSM